MTVTGAPAGGGTRHDTDELQLAAAALLVEAARMDGDVADAELDTIHMLLRERFALSDAEASALLAAARDSAEAAAELWSYARVIKDRFDAEERIALVEMLWEVAYADGVLHDYEAHLLRRIAGLIYVSDRDRGAARKRVLARLGLEGGG